MINLARGSVVLSFLVLIAGLFYFQPKAEAAFNLANNSQNFINKEETNFINKEETNVAELTATKNIETLTIKDDKDKKSSARSFRATAYCLKGRMANGSNVRRGVVAADPRVLPLGTRIYVNAGPYSGNYLVADTGGVVKGRILDFWVPSCSEAMRFGRRNVSVSVLGR